MARTTRLARAGMVLAVLFGSLPLLLPVPGGARITPADPARPAGPAPIVAVRLRTPELPLPSAWAQRQAATHTVTAGETLWEIARATGTRVAALAAANRITGLTLLHPGQVLSIPAPGAPDPAPVRMAQASRTAPARPPAQTAGSTRRVIEAAVSRAARRVQMLWPSMGIITSRFGWRIHPIFGGREFHTGMDIATRWGSPVIAARSGIVRFVGWKSGYGRIVIVDHGDGMETAYSHLSAAVVNPGQRVEQG